MANFYDKASLVLIPSGTKEGVLFSQKPTNGDGDFTFSRSTSATRVGASGYIEKETQNLVPYSNTFSSWSITSVLSPTTGHTGYDGTSNAWKIVPNTSNTSHRVWYPSLGLGYSVYTISIYAKAAGYSTMYVYQNSTGADYASWFDLSTGSVGSGTGRIDTTITDVGDGWYRCTLTGVEDLSSIEIYVGNGTESISFAGDGTSGILIQDAQLEQGLVARDYIETTTSAVYGGITDNIPRLDYTDSSCPSLLLEPQRTNLITHSEYFSAHTLINVTANANASTSPEGVENAYEIVESASSGEQTGYLQASCTSGNDYTITIFAKANTRNYFFLRFGAAGGVFTNSYAWFNLSNGTKGTIESGITADIEDYGNGWYRLIVTRTAAATATGRFFWGLADANGSTSYTGDGSSSVYTYGFQVEEGSYATSYIPTYGASVTKLKDECSVTGVSDFIGQTEGTLFVEGNAVPSAEVISLNRSTSGSIFILSSSSGTVQFYAWYGNGVTINHTTTIDATSNFKVAFSYKDGDSALYCNGQQIAIKSEVFDPQVTLSSIWIAQGNYASSKNKVNANQALVFKTRLSNEELEALTTI